MTASLSAKPATAATVNGLHETDRLGRLIGSIAKPSLTAAIYHPSDVNLRAINIFGKWQLQRNSGESGTREHDPWLSIGHTLRIDAKCVFSALANLDR
jgi:hypothetical protein